VRHRGTVFAGGLCLVVGALAFVGVFSYLAATFDYPEILDGAAADVLPRLVAGGEAMRATWALYAFLPLLLVPGAAGAAYACPRSRGRGTVAVAFATMGALAMTLGLLRWPTVHWTLAEAWSSAGPDARVALDAMFRGLNLYLGNGIGEFLGEVCLGLFFLLNARSLRREPHFAPWLGWAGTIFAVLFLVGAFRNVAPAVQPVADVNNLLLPLWMIVLGVALVVAARRGPSPRGRRSGGGSG
jgi:hypothetical protein